MVPYGIPRRKGRYDNLSDNDPVSLEPNNNLELVLFTIMYVVITPFLKIAGWVVEYVKGCHDSAYLLIKQLNYKAYKNRKK